MSDLRQWWDSMPLVTKYLLASSFILTILPNFGLIPAQYLTLEFYYIWSHFQIWRLITPFFYHGRLGFNFLIHMLFLYQYGKSLEQNTFAGRMADFIYMIIIGGIVILLPALYLGFSSVGMGLIMMLIYYWARKNPNVKVSFLFGITFQSQYLPWVMCGLSILLGGFPLLELIGIVAGHAYLFLDEICPRVYGLNLIQTPEWLKNLVPPQFNRYSGFAPGVGAATTGPSAFRGGHAWGQGRSLR